MRSWIILIIFMIGLGVAGFYYAHYLIEGINYVATWGQGLVLAEPIVSPIPILPGWVYVSIGVIISLLLEDFYMRIKFKIKRKLFRRRSHSKEVK